MQAVTPRRTLLAGSLIFIACSPGAQGETPADDPTLLREVTVTGAREAQPVAETPAAVNSVSGDTLRDTRPAHPSQIMNQIPGVWVNITGGEGHQTAIRHPLTTSPVYLYLEDGIPTRSTGFFNHNALYEINVPQADGIEITKGPGSALQGSDAIGGVINVLTRAAPLAPEFSASLEAGDHGWWRTLLTGGNTIGNDGVRGDLNITHTDGWRDATTYDRQSAGLRWDRVTGDGALVKTVINYSNIDQETAGSSAISYQDYQTRPTINYTPISFREVQAVRLSTAYEKEDGPSLVSLTPYARYNNMDLLPNWSLSYDPTVYNTQNSSLGLLAKYRRDFSPLRTRLIAGVDLERSPGSRYEQSINAVKTGPIYTSYTIGQPLYDYAVTYQGIAPYLQGEISPIAALRITAGLRYDTIRYDYTTHLAALDTGNWKRPADARIDYRHTSPKLGATYAINPRHNVFVNYSHGFRAPSESQLFRQGSALNTVGLQPVRANNYEIGLRARPTQRLDYQLSLYYLSKKDDILSYRNPATGLTQAVNAGVTLHRGVEAGVGARLAQRWRVDTSLSYAKHTYEEWIVSGSADYSGNEMETAPRTLANTRLGYTPALLQGGTLTLEWIVLGPYWMDAANTHEYDGHRLLNLRANLPVGAAWEVYGRIGNVADRRYAESSSYTTSRGEEFAPGMPRTLYLGVQYNWKAGRAATTGQPPAPAPGE